uniref:Uncharacterized protein n=1 Tax=Steinernema glaseri TaxID=37863 RepID=A0A1I7YNP6_9BILA
MTDRSQTRQCTNGKVYFFKKSTANDWEQLLKNEKFAFRFSCPEACVCVTEEECYQPSKSYMRLYFTPFCEGDLCAIYMLFEGGRGNGIVPIGKNGTTIIVNSQLKPGSKSLMALPGNYKKITAVGCGGCPVERNC